MADNDTPAPPPEPAVAADAHALAGPAPVLKAERIESLDVIRGVAVLGILLMNIGGFALADEGARTPLDVGVHSFADVFAWVAEYVFFEGTMRGLFSMLFGAGVILLTSRIEARANPHAAMKIHYVRNAWLILFGLIHAYILLWPGDILYIYGLTALFLFPIRKLPPIALIILAIVVLLGMTGLQNYLRLEMIQLEQEVIEARAAADAGQELTPEQEDAIDEWRGWTVIDAAAMREQVETMRSGYIPIFRELAPGNLKGHTLYTIKWSLWDAASVMLIGMAFMKWGILSGVRSIWLYVLMMLVGYATGVSVNVMELAQIWTADFHPVTKNTAWLTYDVGRVALAIGHVGAIVLFVRSGLVKWLARMLAAAGRMALTNYIVQTIICTLIFYGYGLGMYDRFDRAELLLFVVGIWVFQLVVSLIWLRYFRFGPLEWFWRSLTYWKRQAMRRTTTTSTTTTAGGDTLAA